MALKVPTYTNFGPHVILVKWTVAVGDTFVPASLPEHTDRSIHIYGNFAGSASLALHGSNDDAASGANLAYVVTKDADGSTITGKVAAYINTVRDVANFMKPILTSGNGSTAVTVGMLCRRNRP